jgi:hypothetical protein
MRCTDRRAIHSGFSARISRWLAITSHWGRHGHGIEDFIRKIKSQNCSHEARIRITYRNNLADLRIRMANHVDERELILEENLNGKRFIPEHEV